MSAQRPIVDVCHPGAVNTTYAQVAALQAAGFDGVFFTSYYHKGGERALGLLPRNLRAAALAQLQRRQGPGIDPSRVDTAPLLEALYVAASRAGAPAGWRRALIDLRNRRFDRRMARVLARRRPDLVIGNDGAAELTFDAARRLGVPTLLNQVIGHDAVGAALLAEEYRRDPDFAERPPGRRHRIALETRKREVLLADRILAPSAYVRDTLIEVGVAAERIELLPYGVDVERFRPGPGRDDSHDGPLRLLFVGQISQRKGLRYLLEALRGLPRADYELTLAGSLAVPPAALAPYRGLYRHLPNQPYHRIHEVFQQADVFVYPSLHEGSALAVYEALASGLPVVTTRNTGSVVRDGEEGLLVPIRDAEALAGALEALRRDSPRRLEMAKAARRRAETYTWQRYGERLEEIVRSMLAERRT